MTASPIRDIVIVGGGTAGWMAAATLAALLPAGGYRYRLVESDQIATIGVGEASIPSLRAFNEQIGIDELEFMRATQATYKLGIEFVDWGKLGDSYIHGFGMIGRDQPIASFYHYWLRQHLAGSAPALEQLSINAQAARAGKFAPARKDLPNSPLADIGHAFHFDAGLYATFLRRYSEARGVRRTQGTIVDVVLRAENGHIEALLMDNGERIAGDFFLDCSGLSSLLTGKVLDTPYEDWSAWLPCDSAIAVPCAAQGPLLPLTRSTARAAGWQWRIPLQHRTGNGYVFSSKFIGPAEAEALLMANLDGEPLAAPRLIKFTTGKRKRAWNRNCVAIGLSGGFLEPLESTSIHMVSTALLRLLSLFPDRGFEQVDIDTYNRMTDKEYEQIRDFLILHYRVTTRTDSPFWDYCRQMELPSSLQTKLDLFAGRGRIFRENNELFAEASWLQVMHGQGLRARGYNPVVDQRASADIDKFLDITRATIRKCVDAMPMHADFVAKYCKANPALTPSVVSR